MDRQELTLISLWIHVPFIIMWVGLIMLDAAALFAPGLGGEQRRSLILWSRPFVLLAIPVILATGIWQTMENPFQHVDSWSTLEKLRHNTTYGQMLFFKHGCVIATFGLTILVRFILTPRMRSMVSAAGEGATMIADEGTLRLTKLAAVANLGFCLAAVLLATRMVDELH